MFNRINKSISIIKAIVLKHFDGTPELDLLIRYQETIELMKFLQGDEYLTKILLTTLRCYDLKDIDEIQEYCQLVNITKWRLNND